MGIFLTSACSAHVHLLMPSRANTANDIPASLRCRINSSFIPSSSLFESFVFPSSLHSPSCNRQYLPIPPMETRLSAHSAPSRPHGIRLRPLRLAGDHSVPPRFVRSLFEFLTVGLLTPSLRRRRLSRRILLSPSGWTLRLMTLFLHRSSPVWRSPFNHR